MNGAITLLAVAALSPSPTNPRKRFDEAALQELATSIKHDGLLSPIIVRHLEVGYEIVAGERRYRAATIAEVVEVPCIVRDLSDDDVLRIQVIENLQREDVHPLEEAEGFKALLDRGLYDAKGIADATGKSEAYVHARLRLSELTELPRLALEQELIGIGHALLIARCKPDEQVPALRLANVETTGDQLRVGWNGATKLPELRRAIENSFTRHMSNATWDLDDSVAEGTEGPCTTCRFRTANNGNLFPELEGEDRCTNRLCWELKREGVFQRKKAQLEAKGPVVLVSESHGKSIVEGAVSKDDYKSITLTDGDFDPENPPESLPEGTVMALVADGLDRGKIVPVVLNPKAAAKVLGGDEGAKASEQETESRRARKEQLRMQRTEKLARKRVFDTVRSALAAMSEEEALSFASANAAKLIPAAFAKISRMSGQSIYDSQDGVDYKHPGRSLVWDQLPLPKYYGDEGEEKVFAQPFAKCLEGFFVAATYDEICVGEAKPEKHRAVALFAFAVLLRIDIAGIRKQAEFDTLSKKQQAERLKESQQ